MHIHRQRSRRSIVSEPPLLTAHLGQTQAGSAKLFRDGQDEILRGAKFFEVLIEEAILPIIGCDARLEARQHLLAQNVFLRQLIRGLSCCGGLATVAR